MNAEYKRDMNHNYLVIHGESEIDTSAYQVRMLVGNVIPSLLKCRIQGMDGNFSIYYDITSRQSLAAFYEDRKLEREDLKLIFGEFIRVMEDAAEYLMNPGQLVIVPEYMFLEVEKKEIYFCMMPGYQKEVREQFQALTEYILPKIDHEDEKAVMLGYGIYRRALEDSFHLEHIKEELYRVRDGELGKKAERTVPPVEQPEDSNGEAAVQDIFPEENFWENMETKPEKKRSMSAIWKKVLGFGISLVILAVLLIIKMYGFLPDIGVEVILGAVLVCMGVGMIVFLFIKKKKIRLDDVEDRTEKAKGNREKSVDQEKEKMTVGEKTENVESKGLSSGSCGETVVLSLNPIAGPSSLVSREPGELATIYLEEDLTIIGKLKNASDTVIDLPTVSRVHAKIRKKDGEYYLTDLNSRNGTSVNGRLLKADEEYRLQNEDEVDFAQARYVFLK